MSEEQGANELPKIKKYLEMERMSKLRIAVIDCHDSFVYNLVEMLRHLPGCCFEVFDYDQITTKPSTIGDKYTVARIVDSHDGLLLSPGPGLPEEFPFLKTLIRKSEGCCTILGVCLGMQALCLTYGGELRQLEHPLHGFEDRLSPSIEDDFSQGVPSEALIGRYHSWIVDEKSLPRELSILAYARSDASPMALRHRSFPFYAVQFHPESYISTYGVHYLLNWLSITRRYIQKTHLC